MLAASTKIKTHKAKFKDAYEDCNQFLLKIIVYGIK